MAFRMQQSGDKSIYLIRLLAVLAAILSVVNADACKQCVFNFTSPGRHTSWIEPFIVEAEEGRLILPYLGDDGGRYVEVNDCQTTFVDCSSSQLVASFPYPPRPKVAMKLIFPTESEETHARCSLSKSSASLTITNVEHEFSKISDLTCNRSPAERIRLTSEQCSKSRPRGRIVIVDWPMSSMEGRAIEQLKICHHVELATTVYSDHVVEGPHMDARDLTEGRPPFKEQQSQGLFKFVDANKLYKKSSVRKQLKKFMASQAGREAVDMVFSHSRKGGDGNMIARGHLAPDAAFVPQEFQRATYQYANVVPQWQKMNGGNWAGLERMVRQLAAAKSIRLEVRTGAFGRLKPKGRINKVRGCSTGISLGCHNGNGQIFMPAFMCKLMYAPANRGQRPTSLAICSLNVPRRLREFVDIVADHDDQHALPLDSSALCTAPVDCSALGWSFSSDDSDSGQMYCCPIKKLTMLITDRLDVDSSVFSNKADNLHFAK